MQASHFQLSMPNTAKKVVASELCSAVGLVGLAFLPDFLPDPLVGMIASVVIYAFVTVNYII